MSHTTDTPGGEILKPSEYKPTHIIDPTVDIYKFIKSAPSVKTHKILLPTKKRDFLSNQPLPFPVQRRYLMLGSAIQLVTQLHIKIITNPNWEEDNQKPLITPLGDVEWIHQLFNHQRQEQYNFWQINYLPAPFINEKQILVALRKVQIHYVEFLLLSKKDLAETRKKMKQLREQFGLLDFYTKNWFIQLLVGHPDDEKMPKMNGDIYCPGTKRSWQINYGDKWIKHTLNT